MSNPFAGVTPSITIAQALAIAAITAALVLKHLGWLTEEEFTWIVVGGVGLKVSDAGLRGSRNIARAHELSLAEASVRASITDHVDTAPAEPPAKATRA